MTDQKIAFDRAELDRFARTLARIAEQIDGSPSDIPLDAVPESTPSRVLRFVADVLRGEDNQSATTVAPIRRAALAEGQR